MIDVEIVDGISDEDLRVLGEYESRQCGGAVPGGTLVRGTRHAVPDAQRWEIAASTERQIMGRKKRGQLDDRVVGDFAPGIDDRVGAQHAAGYGPVRGLRNERHPACTMSHRRP